MRSNVPCLGLLMLLTWLISRPAYSINGLWVHPENVINQAKADETLDQAQRCGIDNVYLLVFHREQAWFRTPHAPMAENVPEDFDPLGYCIEAGHKRGMKVHAWFVNGQGGGGKILVERPDWMSEDAHGGKEPWFDSAKPEVRRFQKDLMLSAVKGYPKLDGIHFDYIRYPSQRLSYAPSVVSAFRKAAGFDPPRRTRFPIEAALSANPAHAATTGKVLAVFDTGVPAIIENRLGKGRALLFNWHAELSDSAALDTLLAARLREYGGESRRIRVLVSEQNERRYGSSFRLSAVQWLGQLGFTSTNAELGENRPGAEEILVVPNVYVWSESEASLLRKLVEEGMNVIWIDGPAKDMPDIMAVLGVDRPDAFFSGVHTITPVVDDPAMPVDTEPRSRELEDKQEAMWRQWRMDCISDLVRDVYRSAKRIRPSIEVTAAVFYTKANANSVLQDWQRWVREGFIDYVIPMAYVGNLMALEKAFDEWEQLPKWRERVIPGLSIYRDSDLGAVPRSPDLVERQIGVCKRRGAWGIVYFCCHYISQELEPVLRSGAR